MQREEITELVEYLTKLEQEINMTKGREYAGDSDALANFKLAAEIVGISPLQVCLVYMFKTFMSMGSYAKHNMELSTEPIEGRVLDLRLYGALFLALAKERQPVPVNLAEELKSMGKPLPIDLVARMKEIEGKTDG